MAAKESKTGLSDESEGREFLVVGLGASAGGIQALQEFFEHVPADSGVAYVVILHLSPDHDSRLAQVLQTVSRIPVTQVTEQVRIEPDHVYVVPPNQHLEMRDSFITVSPNTTVEDRRAPVDIFFRALAESHDSKSVAVILSGTGANGSMGLKRVKEHGGATFVQNPREAEFNEMPRNAIATDLVDDVLPVAEIPKKIIAYKESLGKIAISVEAERRPKDQQQALREIFTQLRVRTGHDFSNYKRATVLRRIERRINVRQLPDLPAYAKFLRENADETQALLKDLLISVTNFFRDKKAFEAIEREILPRILHAKSSEDQVRVWVAGCATGEEAYSMAMLLAERTHGLLGAPKIQIFATDIDEAAIANEREGFYTINDAADVSPERLRRFFVPENGGYRVRRELREMVLFAVHNIIKDPPFSHLDLVTCRNLLIYLNAAAQDRVLETLHFALNPGGYLFIGSSESVDSAGDLYAPVNKEFHIYQSREAAARVYPVPDASPSFRFEPPRRSVAETEQTEKRALERITYSDLHQRLLEQYAPPSLVVNEDYDIVHLSESAGQYLQIAGGEPSKNLLKLIRPELRLELHTALYQATEGRKNVEVKNLQVRLGERTEIINIRIRPVFRETDTARGFILVVFEPSDGNGAAAETVVTAPDTVARQLEEELMRTKAQLRTAIEQNEVQIEELKTSNEELQSMNEELTTVNQELKIKIEELSQSNNNFRNLINSTNIATIFLDRSFRVQLFTPAARAIFNLLPNDIGRPVSDITNRLIGDDLIDDAEAVLEKLQTVEREVRTTDGRDFFMRALPYRTAEDHISGVVATFFDITSRKRAEEALRQSEERFRLLVESVKDYAIFTIDENLRVRTWNMGAEAIFGYAEAEIIGQSSDIIFTPEDREGGEPQKELETARAKGAALDERWHTRKDGTRFFASGVLMRLPKTGAPEFAKIVRDITERKEMEDALRRSRDELDARVRERTRELEREVAERRAAEEQVKDLLRQLVSTQELERQRLSRELHDQLGQQLTALRLNLDALETQSGERKDLAEKIGQTKEVVQNIDREIDFLAWELRPALLDELGLLAALDAYVKQWSKHFNIALEFHAAGLDDVRLAPEIETNIYRILQEALNNIAKHAEATQVDVILESRKDVVALIIEDNGKGFGDGAELAGRRGLGLIGMRERAALINGTVEFESTPSVGTTVFVRVPARLS